MLILSIESSCDETSAAVVEMSGERRVIRSNRVASQIAVHALYGGVVPEIASRCHIEAISRLTYDALEEAGVTMREIDAVGVTNRPGLIGALLVGVSFAKSLALAYDKPLVPVHHIRGHIAANYLCHPELKPPYMALVVSGGHTSLIHVTGYTDFHTVGRTRDDACGEAFDKVARVMGIPYPGGAEMDRLASLGDPAALKMPSAAIAGDTLDFSFSGLKTFVINYLHTKEQKGESYSREDVAASFTADVCASIVKRVDAACRQYDCSTLVLAGGVAANSHLREALAKFAGRRHVQFYMPDRALCGDNAAMIGAQTYFEYLAGNLADSSLNAFAVDYM